MYIMWVKVSSRAEVCMRRFAQFVGFCVCVSEGKREGERDRVERRPFK